ncbi:MAG TPA: hypothetical protein VGV93_02470 [Acidimicrobiales bacterium]|nr:hypothetical protein [Acidimicrobiales bacterium]
MNRPRPPDFTCELEGIIASAGFSSGHRFVVGHWDESPIGPFDDVMWARPDGTRLLLVARSEAAEFITAVYRFDTVDAMALECRMDGALLRVSAGDLRLTMQGGRPWRIPLSRLRSRAQVRPFEGLVARALFGVRTWGVSPTGVSEWYRADEYRPVVSADACLGNQELGTVRPFHEPAGFGFSEPPRRPSMVTVRPLLHDPSGRLAEVAGDRHGGRFSSGSGG